MRRRVVMETEAPVTGPPGPGGPHAGTHRWAGAALASSIYTGELPTSGVGLSERLSALARLVQIGSARVGPDGFGAAVLADAKALLARAGERLRLSAQHTIVVLAGGTGSGKSSLFNALLGTARAIVTDVPGTTRDALEARLEIDGIVVRLVDTAGLREAPDDTVERIGIEVASRYLGAADAVLVCGEDAGRLATADARIAALTPAPRIGVRTKSDLVPKGDESGTHIEADSYYQVATSAATGAGLGELAAALARALAALRPREDGADGMLTRERHRRAVARARTSVVAFADAWRGGVIPSPVAATHLREAAAALEELIGAVQPDDVLDAVFRSFCVGK